MSRKLLFCGHTFPQCHSIIRTLQSCHTSISLDQSKCLLSLINIQNYLEFSAVKRTGIAFQKIQARLFKKFDQISGFSFFREFFPEFSLREIFSTDVGQLSDRQKSFAGQTNYLQD